ncbi:MAG: DNA repair protein RecO [Bacteroidales bacterium]
MLQKTKGIVLHHFKYGDTSLITHIYTRKFGRHSFLVKGARSKKSRLRSNLFQLLNILDIEFYYKESTELFLLKEANRSISLNSFPYDVKRSSQAIFMAEVLYRCLLEQASDPDLYDFLENSIEYFDLMEEDSSNFHLAFLMKLTRYLGILPSFEENEEINSLDILEGKFTRSIPVHFQYINTGNARVLFQLFIASLKDSSEVSLSRSERNVLLQDIIRFYSANGYKIDNLNSLPVLKELFS